MGAIGRPVMPPLLRNAARLIPWESLGDGCRVDTWRRVLVVGGRLTAIQVVQKSLASSSGCRATICTRRPLLERHSDLQTDWFDRHTTNKRTSDLYRQSDEQRLPILKARNGGSVSAIYMRQVRELEKKGRLRRRVDNEAEYLEVEGNGEIKAICLLKSG
jgi:hypothetical protein